MTVGRNNTPRARKSRQDWDAADIICALRKAGWSLRRLSLASGYRTNVLSDALRKSYPKAERLIAAALRVHPKTIWPSRYEKRGKQRRANRESAA